MTKKLQPNKHSNINNTISPINILVAKKNFTTAPKRKVLGLLGECDTPSDIP